MSASRAQPPRIWVVRSYRAGENSQITALADALGYGYETKSLVYRRRGVVANLLRQVTLAGIERRYWSRLQPPWPDLAISAGLRNEPVCRWIRARSREHTRLVHIGRPWAALECFDLVITTPQYRLPNHPHVLQNELTLTSITEPGLAEAASIWGPRLAHLPAPYLAVMVGGNSGPYALGPRAAATLGKAASRQAMALGASLLVSTSARTPKDCIEELKKNLTTASHLFEWTPDRQDNPYMGFLALAEGIIVTADSIAMLSEACATGKPVYIFDPSRSTHPDLGISSALYHLMMKVGPRRLSRDATLVHRQQIDAGRAVWLGDTFPGRDPDKPRDLERAVERVQDLLRRL